MFCVGFSVIFTHAVMANDIPKQIIHSKPALFADDSTLYLCFGNCSYEKNVICK